MKTSYRLKLSKLSYWSLGLMSVAFVAVITVNIVNLTKWMPSENAYFGLNIAATVLLFLALALCALAAFNSRYVLKQDKMLLVFGVFFLKIPYKNMKQIRTDGKGFFLLYYLVRNRKEGDKITFIRLNSVDNDGLAKKLAGLNDEMTYEIVETE